MQITKEYQFQTMVEAYHNRSSTLFTPEGQQRRGSTIACHFWSGFNGGKRPAYVSPSDPSYKAGQHCNKADK